MALRTSRSRKGPLEASNDVTEAERIARKTAAAELQKDDVLSVESFHPGVDLVVESISPQTEVHGGEETLVEVTVYVKSKPPPPRDSFPASKHVITVRSRSKPLVASEELKAEAVKLGVPLDNSDGEPLGHDDLDGAVKAKLVEIRAALEAARGEDAAASTVVDATTTTTTTTAAAAAAPLPPPPGPPPPQRRPTAAPALPPRPCRRHPTTPPPLLIPPPPPPCLAV